MVINFPMPYNSSAIEKLPNLKKIEVMEWYLRNRWENAITGDDLEIAYPLKHSFANGTYSRQISLPKGHFIVGKTHKYEHISILSQGRVSIMTPDGIEHRESPDIWVSPAGTKRLIYVHEDAIWTTIHRTLLTNPEEIVEKIAFDSDLSWIPASNLLPGGKNDHCSSGCRGSGGGNRSEYG